MERNIINISIEKLVPHPLNPRKDLGDLTELTESIKENGVLQNLTVTPRFDIFDSYTVIIGHRRLAAAKLAGLNTVSCSVVHLDEKQQVAMMLLENMQRVDLTPIEQAKGIQQCLDFGMTEADITKQTGLSKKKVKHRLNILKLDQESVQSVNASIDDFIQLESIKDIDARNKLLKHMGTNNFGIEVEKAKLKQNKVELSNKKVEADAEVVKEPEIVKASFELRKNFMKDVFKRKITPNEIAKAVGVVNEMFIQGIDSNHNKNDLFQEIVNPNKMESEELVIRMLKNRSNFIVVAAFELLEVKNDKNAVYNYLEEFGYVMSDDEKGMLVNA